MKIQIYENKLQIEFDSEDGLSEIKDLYSRLRLCDDEIEEAHLNGDREHLSGWADDHMSGDLLMKLGMLVRGEL